MACGAGGLLLAGACAVVHVDPVPVGPRDTAATPTPPPRGARFYQGIPVGSESQFNPFSLVINGGFDEMRLIRADRHVFDMDYGLAADGVWKSVTQPDRVVRVYGTDQWIRRQLLPLSMRRSGGGQWVPNYLLHLFGGGMTGVRVTEWYRQRDYAHPELATAATVATWHVVTEMVEHRDGVPTADAMSDLLIFDPAAFLLFRNDRVQRLFSTHFQMTNWPGQPAIDVPEATLQNMQMTAMIRADNPWSRDYRVMATFGASYILGISRRQAIATDWLSIGAGIDPIETPIIDATTREKTVKLNPNFGIFYDRNGSLLAAFHVRLNRAERVLFNVYPGVVHFGKWSPGLYVHYLDDGRFRFGIVPKWGLGLGGE